MVGASYVNDRLKKLGQSNSYYFEITKSDGTSSPGSDPGLDLAEPPVKVLIDFATDFISDDKKEEVTRYSLQNRVVKIFCATPKKITSKIKKDDKEEDVISYEENDPVEIGSFVVNSLSVNWDIYDVLKKHPLSLKGLIDICMSYHLGNLLPSQN